MATHRLDLKFPIVLVPGLGGKATIGPIEYFYGIPRLLRAAGNRVSVPNLSPFHTVATRARQLKAHVEQAFPNEKVNLVGHSFGGLDARYLAANFGFTERIASITTIGTPNHGTVIADIALGLLPDTTFHAVDLLLSPLKNSSRAYQQLTRKYCMDELPLVAPKMHNVAYYSATSVIRSPILKTALPLFWLPNKVIDRYEGANDGFVSERSARFGEHICTYQGDHYAQIGQLFGRARGLDYRKFYAEIIGRLKRDGY